MAETEKRAVQPLMRTGEPATIQLVSSIPTSSRFRRCREIVVNAQTHTGATDSCLVFASNRISA